MTREEVEDELKIITSKTQNAEAVKIAMEKWLELKKCTDFEISQILNDLTGYSEYLALVN